MKALQGYINPRFEWICPKCNAIYFVDVLDFFKATAGGSGMRCDVCRIAYEVKIELLDPRSPTLRAAVQSEQNLAVPEDIEVRVQLRNLLGYLEIDLENRELDHKDAWEETYQVVNNWLNTPNSNRSDGG